MPDVVTILTKDPKTVPTTAAWLAALALVTVLIEGNAFPDTSANAPLTGKRGVVEALPGGGDFPDRYVVFLAATADSGQRRLAVKREHLEFFARGL